MRSMDTRTLLVSEVEWWLKQPKSSLRALARRAGIGLSRLQRLVSSDASGRTADDMNRVIIEIRKERKKENP